MRRLCILLLAFWVGSCATEPTLQQYFVEKSEDGDFVTVDFVPDNLNLDRAKLTAEQREAVGSFRKMNILAFQKTEGNTAKYEAERIRVDSLLQDEQYQELMHISGKTKGGSLRFVGTENEIEEFVVYAHQADNGFAVVRVLGDNMTPDDVYNLMSVMRSANVDPEALKPLQELFPTAKR